MKIFGIVGWKNNGKTRLLERLVSEISGRGIVVSTVKHAHHKFDVDHEGKDSFRHREAGAHEVLLSSRHRWALMHEVRDEQEPTLDEMLSHLSPVDLVMIEGYKRDPHPKIEVHRASVGQPLITRDDPTVVAVASDIQFDDLQVPVFDLDDAATISDFILKHTGLI